LLPHAVADACFVTCIVLLVYTAALVQQQVSAQTDSCCARRILERLLLHLYDGPNLSLRLALSDCPLIVLVS